VRYVKVETLLCLIAFGREGPELSILKWMKGSVLNKKFFKKTDGTVVKLFETYTRYFVPCCLNAWVPSSEKLNSKINRTQRLKLKS